MRKQLMYLGETVSHIGDIFQTFKDKKMKKYYYTGIKGIWPGSVYRLNEDGTMKVRYPEQVESDWKMTVDEQFQYEAQKEIVKTERLRKRKSMEIKRPHKDIVTAVDLLRPFFLSLSRFDQDRFTSYLKNEMSKKKRKK